MNLKGALQSIPEGFDRGSREIPAGFLEVEQPESTPVGVETPVPAFRHKPRPPSPVAEAGGRKPGVVHRFAKNFRFAAFMVPETPSILKSSDLDMIPLTFSRSK